jgi:hypothetical protein
MPKSNPHASTAIAPQNPITTCDTDGMLDGFSQFDLEAQATPQVLTGLPSGLIVAYFLNPQDAIIQQNQVPNIFKKIRFETNKRFIL